MIAPDFTKSVLNVPAMNYSVLLPRSIDYETPGDHQHHLHRRALAPAAAVAGADAGDRAEPNGYAHR